MKISYMLYVCCVRKRVMMY